MTINYPSVYAHRKAAGKCPICNKRVVRTRTFEHTINPFNKNKDGSIKDHNQVRSDVDAEAEKWIPNFKHEKCGKQKEQ